MAVNHDIMMREELMIRRNRLKSALGAGKDLQLLYLLNEIDLALERIDANTFGLCEVCREPIEHDRLMADPLVRLCLDHLTVPQQRALEQDIDLAGRVQQTLLPKNNFKMYDWHFFYHYQAAGPVSGDYCDVVELKDDRKSVLAIVGDVSGKGIAASMLMMHLHAMFHSFVGFNLPVHQLMGRVNRLLCESTLSSHYSTLICSQLSADGTIELCNAGHCPPLLVQNGQVKKIEATGLPVGLLCDGEYSVHKLKLHPGESIFFYTDGLSEAQKGDEEYGTDRIVEVLSQFHNVPPAQLAGMIQEDFSSFLENNHRQDDLTWMIVQRI